MAAHEGLDEFFTGFDAPVTAPLYPDPPYYYRGAKVILGIYQADTERVARHMPPGVTPGCRAVQRSGGASGHCSTDSQASWSSGSSGSAGNRNGDRLNWSR